jgi:hypothetical protein
VKPYYEHAGVTIYHGDVSRELGFQFLHGTGEAKNALEAARQHLNKAFAVGRTKL